MSPSNLREDARAIINASLSAADPVMAVKRAVSLEGDKLSVVDQIIDLSRYDKVLVVGAGKAGAAMSASLEEVLGDRIVAGKVVTKDDHSCPTRIVSISESSHPVPDERGVAAGKEIAAILKQHGGPKTLVFSLLSGGGSALLVGPAEGITLEDKQAVTSELLKCGADIGEINTIRKHLSSLKGGNLARLAGESKVISLIISDVVGDRLDVIASGPTVPDLSTWEDVREILQDRFGIWDNLPESVRQRVEKGLAGSLPDTLKPGEPILERVSNYIIAGNRKALDFAADKARAMGYTPLVLSSTIEGETKDIARMHAALAREIHETATPLAPPCCLISGGETTVTMGEDHGLGGRNQEFALAACLDMKGMPNTLLVSVGTDGTDGPTDAAGAWADGETAAKAKEAGMNPRQYLARHDAYHFFDKLDDLIITGPTRTNVMDVRLIMVL
jgi:glycerate 2-kinase